MLGVNYKKYRTKKRDKIGKHKIFKCEEHVKLWFFIEQDISDKK